MATVYLALGTNLGDKAENLRSAIKALTSNVSIGTISPVYETEPVYLTEQPRFYNLALRGETALSPHELLSELKRIERELGREAGERNGPRVIDIDILFYDDLVIESSELIVPHPRIRERTFVLMPLADIAPDFIHPVSRESIDAMLVACSGNAPKPMLAGITL